MLMMLARGFVPRMRVVWRGRAKLAHDELEKAVIELRLTGDDKWRHEMLSEFCRAAFPKSSVDASAVMRSRPWEATETWRAFLDRGEAGPQLDALEALDRGRKRAQDVVEASRLLGLSFMARRIEALDVSHTQGEFPVVASAAVVDGQVDVNASQAWRVEGLAPGNDCGGLAFGAGMGNFEDVDVVVVDGGKPQLGAVQATVSRERGPVVVALAKGERLDGVEARRAGEMLYDGSQRAVARGDAIPRLYRLARDAAHDRALASHRKLRDAAMLLDKQGEEEALNPEPTRKRRKPRKRVPRGSSLDLIDSERLRRALARGLGFQEDDEGSPSLLLPNQPPAEDIALWRRKQREHRDGFVKRAAVEAPPVEFEVEAPFETTGPQMAAVLSVVKKLDKDKMALLKGATGTGKTLCMAKIIAARASPSLVLAPNKVLAAQLYDELKALLPSHAVEYFVSHYDYYRPESFVSNADSYNAKRSAINSKLDELRHKATASLRSRRDVVVVASISCIYGLGLPAMYEPVNITIGDDVLAVAEALERVGFEKGASNGCFEFLENSSTVRLVPADGTDPVQLRFEGSELASINGTDANVLEVLPASHYASTKDLDRICSEIGHELEERVEELRLAGKTAQAEMLQDRTLADMAKLRDTGTCTGIENYVRHLNAAEPGAKPVTLLDYFPPGNPRFLLLVDESHLTIGQIGAAYTGDRARKTSLVANGYRLPSALDNRPLKMDEFWDSVDETVLVSATPGKNEANLLKMRGCDPTPAAELVVRPTFICDPEVVVRPRGNQIEDALDECFLRSKKGEKTIFVTLTRAAARNLVEVSKKYPTLRVEALTGDLKPQARLEILTKLRNNELDAICGVNLLREGIDLPEVSLVAILSCDSEGFLRSETSIVQTIGRAARHVEGTAILYADRITPAMQRAIDETDHRRSIQKEYNTRTGATPTPILSRRVASMQNLIGDKTPSVYDLLANIPQDAATPKLPPIFANDTSVDAPRRRRETAVPVR